VGSRHINGGVESSRWICEKRGKDLVQVGDKVGP
jgi:hypothetical protein